VHVNNLKGYKERKMDVCALTVIADEDDHKGKEVLHVKKCVGFKEADVGSFGRV